MKNRFGFVSNSSSSSFIIVGDRIITELTYRLSKLEIDRYKHLDLKFPKNKDIYMQFKLSPFYKKLPLSY